MLDIDLNVLMRIYHELDRNRHGLLILGQAARRPRVIGHHVDQDAGEFGDGRNIQGCQGRRQNVPLGRSKTVSPG